MTGAETAQIIQACATLVTAIGVAYGVVISRGNAKKADAVVAKVNTIETKVAEVHDATNGMKKELVEMTAKASKAEGKEEERSEERARQELPR